MVYLPLKWLLKFGKYQKNLNGFIPFKIELLSTFGIPWNRYTTIWKIRSLNRFYPFSIFFSSPADTSNGRSISDSLRISSFAALRKICNIHIHQIPIDVPEACIVGPCMGLLEDYLELIIINAIPGN